MLKIFGFVACVVVFTSPASIETDYEDLTPEDLYEILANPRLYEKFINCQNNEGNCHDNGKNLKVSERDSESELKMELDSGGRMWFFSFRRPSLAAILALLNTKKNATDVEIKTVFIRA